MDEQSEWTIRGSGRCVTGRWRCGEEPDDRNDPASETPSAVLFLPAAQIHAIGKARERDRGCHLTHASAPQPRAKSDGERKWYCTDARRTAVAPIKK